MTYVAEMSDEDFDEAITGEYPVTEMWPRLPEGAVPEWSQWPYYVEGWQTCD